MKDMIVAQWFKENLNISKAEDLTFGDINPMVSAIAEYYSAHSVFVSKEFVIDYFNKMNVFDIWCFLETYINDAVADSLSKESNDSSTEDTTPTSDADNEPKSIIDIIEKHIGKGTILTYEEMLNNRGNRKPKKFLNNGAYTKDRSVLGKDDLIYMTSEVPENVDDWYVCHIAGSDLTPLWTPKQERNHSVDRRLRYSFVQYHLGKDPNTSAEPAAVSICNGNLYVKRYMGSKD